MSVESKISEHSPNENKISYVRSRRATCTAGGKAVAEAGNVTTEHVSCIAWLGPMVGSAAFFIKHHLRQEPWMRLRSFAAQSMFVHAVLRRISSLSRERQALRSIAKQGGSSGILLSFLQLEGER